MPSKSRLVSKAFSSSGVLSTIATENPTVDTGTTQIANVDALPTSGNDIGDQLFIEATNRLYIWNGSGWYNIALINTSPTWDSGGQPASSYELDADSPQDATVVTLSASDPEGIPINYSYVTSGQMDSMATISQDSSVFTITPKTFDEVGGEEIELTGSITFRASDGINILPNVSSFVLNFVFTVENSKYTTLLLEAVDTSDNNNIIDSSSNNHAITVTGDVKAGTYSPYRHSGYSTYFDGSGDYLTILHNTTLNMGNGSWTAEMWIYPDGNYTTYNTLFAKRLTPVGSTSEYEGYLTPTNGYLGYYGPSGSLQTSTATPITKTWNHVAYVYDGTNIEIFLNGVSVLDQATSSQDTTADLYIGCYNRDGVIYDYYYGYMCDFKLSKGTAVYTSNFTPPTARLTAITNTSLLTCHLPYIADGSTNNHAITVNGNTSTRAFSPYDGKKYSVTSHGGSIFLDGTGDYLTINDTNIANFGTNDFTIEAWVRCNDTTTNQILDTRPVSTNGAYVTVAVGNSSGVLISTNGAELFPGGVGTINVNQWHHVAWVRNSGTISIYVDGTSVGSASNSTNFISSNVGIGWNAYVGENTGSVYISDLRIVKDTASYTSNFTPPTFPLSSSGTSLHLKGTDASIIDKSQQGGNISLASGIVGDSTTVVHANSKSINFMADDDIFCTFYNPFTFAGEFTIEFYTRIDSLLNGQGANVNGQYHTMLSLGNYFFVRFGDSGFGSDWQIGTASGFPGIDSIGITPSSMVGNGWYHFAMTRDANNDVRYYWNGTLRNSSGVSIGSPNPSTFPNASVNRPGTFGAVGDATVGCGYRGYMQDIRITNGLVRYTGNFTPPTEPLLG